MSNAVDHTSWAPGHISLEHFAAEHQWAKVLDVDSTTALMRRWDRACHLSESHVTSRGHDYQVTSQSNPSIYYTVDLEKGCTCPDALRAAFGWCKHRLAAWQWQKWFEQQQELHRASLEYARVTRITLGGEALERWQKGATTHKVKQGG